MEDVSHGTQKFMGGGCLVIGSSNDQQELYFSVRRQFGLLVLLFLYACCFYHLSFLHV
ncbi:hypothetical protein ACE6H2_015015 [Prunus campanulata]